MEALKFVFRTRRTMMIPLDTLLPQSMSRSLNRNYTSNCYLNPLVINRHQPLSSSSSSLNTVTASSPRPHNSIARPIVIARYSTNDTTTQQEQDPTTTTANIKPDPQTITMSEDPTTPSPLSSEPTTPSDKLYKAIELEVLSYEPSVLDSYQWFVLTSATHLGIKVGKCWSPLKPDKFRFKALKSAFVHKKHVVHYEVRTYHRFMTFLKLTGSTADTFLEYIERNLPEGVGLKVTRVEVKPLPEYVGDKGVQGTEHEREGEVKQQQLQG